MVTLNILMNRLEQQQIQMYLKESETLAMKNIFHLLESYLNERNFTFHNYIPGGPPEINLIRYSTYDINDGRQSLGIQNSFSFIQEGKNGKDSIDNIQRRAEGQATGMMGFLEFVYSNKDRIKSLVNEERSKLISGEVSDSVAIQMEHVSNGEKLIVPLRSIVFKFRFFNYC